MNLSVSGALNEQTDSPLHLKSWFGDDGHVIVRNAYLDSQWGEEERWGPQFPMKAGAPFELIILVTHDDFRVGRTSVSYCS